MSPNQKKKKKKQEKKIFYHFGMATDQALKVNFQLQAQKAKMIMLEDFFKNYIPK